MREKNRTCVFNTSPKLKHLPVPLGVSAVPIVGCTLQPKLEIMREKQDFFL